MQTRMHPLDACAVFAIVTCLLGSAVQAGAEPYQRVGDDAEWVQNPANDHFYALTEPATWPEARDLAFGFGGDLATINDAEENAWILDTFGGPGIKLWIGLTDQEEEGNWVWISGDDAAYRNWWPGEPNDIGTEDWAEFLDTGFWNDALVTYVQPGLVEKDTAEGSLPVVSFAASPRSGVAPVTVQFVDESNPYGSPIFSWEWDFGDGVPGFDQNPFHVYEIPGLYTASLTVTTEIGSDTKTEPDYILVRDPDAGPEWYVDIGNTSGVEDGTTWETAFTTIQQGIDFAGEGHTIIVAEGTYVENIEFRGRNLTVRSAAPTDPAVVAHTVIDGNQQGPVVTFAGTETDTCMLSGFTITNGDTRWGGGICGGTDESHSLARIQHNTITRSEGYYGGGLAWCDGQVLDNTITDNRARGDGGGLSECDGLILRNTITDNWTENCGGGVYLCDGLVDSNIVTGNTGGWGGGIYRCDGVVQNNLVAGNSVDVMGGGACGCRGLVWNNTIVGNSATRHGGGVSSCESATIMNCIVWANESPDGLQLHDAAIPSFSCIQNWTGGGEGNITDAPLFVDVEGGDYHLQPGSPCIDAGGRGESLTNDIDGAPRPVDGTPEPRGDGSDYDIGADEFAPPHSADTDASWTIELTEISRVVTFYSAGGYRCDSMTPDGFAPFDGPRECRPHDSDYTPRDWTISIPELSRLITFYNAGGYRRDPATPDGFAPQGWRALGAPIAR